MKKYLLLSVFLTISIYPQIPFHKGVNLSGWFQADSSQQIQFSKFSKKDFENIKSLGCDVIRLPINLHSMTDGAPTYNLDPLFLSYLDKAIDWAEELSIHFILDNHTFDPSANTDPNIRKVLIPVWKNMAQHFKDRSNLLYYEVLNEPHGIESTEWNSIQQDAVKAIREIDTIHTIIVGPSDWNSYNDLKLMPVYEDTNLIYTFHFYDPFLFSHQGASWTVPSMETLSDISFPYDSIMPPFPQEYEGTWLHDKYNNYEDEGNPAKVKDLIDIAIRFQKERNIPIYCGEFGIYNRYSKNEERVAWYKLVREYFEKNNIPWTMWDYKGGFGIFKKDSNELFENDLNVPLVKALGLNEIK